MSASGKHPVRRVLITVLTALLLLIGAAVTYLVVILVDPQEEEMPLPSIAPIQTRGPGYVIESMDGLARIRSDFPGPVLMASDSSPLQLTAGQWEDQPLRPGFARTVTLVYSLDHVRCTVCSTAPGDALSLYSRENFHLTAQENMIAGRAAATFESSSEIRVQLLLDHVLYTVTIPKRNADDLETVLRSLALSVRSDS